MGVILVIAIVIIIISYYLYLGLRESGKVSWINIYIGASLFLICCGWIILITIYDDILGVLAFVQILFGVGASIFSGVILAISLKRWRKVIGLMVAVGIPLALFAIFEIARPYSPDSVIRRNGEEIIAKALNEYYIDNKAYPETLDELVPTYIIDLKQPKTIWGWLYSSNKIDFTLGYVYYIDKMGYSICKFSASFPKWDCSNDYSTAPFSIDPTPWP